MNSMERDLKRLEQGLDIENHNDGLISETGEPKLLRPSIVIVNEGTGLAEGLTINQKTDTKILFLAYAVGLITGMMTMLISLTT